MRTLEEFELPVVSGGFLDYFLAARSDEDRLPTFSGPNGCTAVPNAPFGFNFKPACDRHDINYSAGTNLTKAQADNTFKNDMLNICKTEYDNSLLCIAAANVYYAGVVTFGGLFYEGGK